MRIVLLDQCDGLHGRDYGEKEDGNGISKMVPARLVRIVCSMVERSAPTIFTWLLGRTMDGKSCIGKVLLISEFLISRDKDIKL